MMTVTKVVLGVVLFVTVLCFQTWALNETTLNSTVSTSKTGPDDFSSNDTLPDDSSSDGSSFDDDASLDDISDMSDDDGSGQIGDFIFDKPNEKKAWKQAFPIGSTMRLQWHVAPDSVPPPETVSISYRLGLWQKDKKPNEFVYFVRNETNKSYYDWEVPYSLVNGKYVLRIETSDPGDAIIRARVIGPVIFYVPSLDNASVKKTTIPILSTLLVTFAFLFH